MNVLSIKLQKLNNPEKQDCNTVSVIMKTIYSK